MEDAIIDFEALKTPISDEMPAGKDPRNDTSPYSAYYSLKDVRNNARSSERNALVDNDVITTIHGRSQILPNGDLLVEQTQSGRLLYYDGLGSLQWQHVNRASDGRVYPIRWSRLLYENDDLENVDSLLDAERCN